MHALDLFWERFCCIQGMLQQKEIDKCLKFSWSCAFFVLARKLKWALFQIKKRKMKKRSRAYEVSYRLRESTLVAL